MTARSTPASSIIGTSFSMVKGSGSWGLAPGTHGQSADSAFHRWTCESTIVRLRTGCATICWHPCVARARPAPRALLRKLRRDNMVSSSLRIALNRHSHAPIPNSNWHGLQRLDLHLAPFDGAAGSAFVKVAKLEGERSLRELAVLDIYRLGTVEHDGQLRTLGGDLIGVPFAAGLGHGRYLGHIDDGPGAVLRLRALVIDIHLVGALGADVFGIGNANKDAAVL